MKAVDVTVTGRVQGVSFRWYLQQEAERRDVTGWVRNEPDGSVAGHLEGEPAAVDAVVDWCREGPRPAQVEHLDVRVADSTGATGFDVRG